MPTAGMPQTRSNFLYLKLEMLPILVFSRVNLLESFQAGERSVFTNEEFKIDLSVSEWGSFWFIEVLSHLKILKKCQKFGEQNLFWQQICLDPNSWVKIFQCHFISRCLNVVMRYSNKFARTPLWGKYYVDYLSLWAGWVGRDCRFI